jgi:hypothetical protein
MPLKRKFKLLGIVIGIAVAGGIIVGFAIQALSTATIVDLIRDNRELKVALTNLTEEEQIGYAKVLEQTERDGKLFTRLLFVQTDRTDPAHRILEREYEIEGDVIYFDALIVKFNSRDVAEGRERALYLWRRVWGETMSPSQGFPIEREGEAPRRYADLMSRLSLNDQKLFWSEIWQLSNDPERLRDVGVTAIYGNAVYKKIRPGLIYIFKINRSGGLYPETVPDL